MSEKFEYNIPSDNTIDTSPELDTAEMSDPVDVPVLDNLEEEQLQDTLDQTNMLDSDEISEEDMWQEDQSDASDSDWFNAPKVLKRDEQEMWDIGTNAIEERLDMMRDDLRDKGWPDGPEMEALISAERPKLLEEFQRDMQGDFSHPYPDPVFPEYPGEQTDSTIYNDASVETEKPPLSLESSQQEWMGTSDQSANEADSSDIIPFLNEEKLVEDIESNDSSISQISDSLSEQAEEYPNNDSYFPAEWENIYDEAAIDQTSFDKELEEGSISDHSMELVDDPSIDTLPLSSDSIGDDSDIEPLDDVSNWLTEVNPNFDEFDPESPYCNNCGSCAYAVYQRLEGNSDACASAENIGYNNEMTALTGMEQVSMSPQEIEKRLLEQGEGAHAIIGIDRAEGAGHWFNAACINGRVVAIDGQTGEISEWPPDYGDVVNWEMSVRK